MTRRDRKCCIKLMINRFKTDKERLAAYQGFVLAEIAELRENAPRYIIGNGKKARLRLPRLQLQ